MTIQPSSSKSSTMTLPTAIAESLPQSPKLPVAPVSTKMNNGTVELGPAEQFVIGIVSGILSAMGFSPLKWILYVVILPSMALELWEAYQITFGKPDMAEMKQRKRLRQQQFGHGVISGSGVSHMVADLIFQPSIYTVLNVIMHLCLSMCWSIFWSLPTMSELEQALRDTPKTESFFTKTPKSASLLKKQKKRSSSSSRRKKQKTELPMGDKASVTPQRRLKVASHA